jgi:hypothetical protein
MKNQSQSNQTAASMTEDLKFILNMLRENKDERRVLVASTTSGAYRNNHTKGQLQLQAQQGQELTRERYSPDGMKHISGRRKFIGRLKAADKVTANRASQVKASKKSARPRQIEVTQAERDALAMRLRQRYWLHRWLCNLSEQLCLRLLKVNEFLQSSWMSR